MGEDVVMRGDFSGNGIGSQFFPYAALRTLDCLFSAVNGPGRTFALPELGVGDPFDLRDRCVLVFPDGSGRGLRIKGHLARFEEFEHGNECSRFDLLQRVTARSELDTGADRTIAGIRIQCPQHTIGKTDSFGGDQHGSFGKMRQYAS